MLKVRDCILIVIIILVISVVSTIAQEDSDDSDLPPEGNIVVVDSAFVRSGPSNDYLPVGALFSGDEVTPVNISPDGQWVLIPYSRGTGWIQRILVRWEDEAELNQLPIIEANITPTPRIAITNTPFIPTATPIGNYINVEGASSAYVRAGPGRGYLRLGQLLPGELVEPVARNDDTSWIMVRYSDDEQQVEFGWLAFELVYWEELDDLAALPVITMDNLTPTATFTPSRTPSVTPTPSSTTTSTSSPTATLTQTLTPSLTNTSVPTVTDAATNTSVPPTATSTHTPVPSATHTPIPPTATNTSSPSPLPTETNTNTPVPSATHTETPSPTNTAIPTETETPTSTNTVIPPTATNTNTPMPSATYTPIPPTNTAIVAVAVASTNTVEPSATTLSTLTMTSTATDISAVDSTSVAVEITAIPPANSNNAPNPTIFEETPIDSERNSFPIAIETMVGLVILLIVLAYIWFYWQGLSATGRYANGFVIERCPVCQRGELQVDERPARTLGIPTVRRTVRCDVCRSVLRETGSRRWRYAVDRLENPTMYTRFNGKQITDADLERLNKTPSSGASMQTTPEFVDGDDD